jgi:hypothetical protein
MDRLEIDLGIFFQSDQEIGTLLVLEEEVLGVTAGYLIAQPWDSATVNTGA